MKTVKRIFLASVFTTIALTVYSSQDAKDLDLYLLIGQSNMAGRGKLTAENRISSGRIYKLDAQGQWQQADEPIHFDKKVAGVGLAASFARMVADRDKDVKIGLIPCAVGGTRIDRWIEGGDLWSNAVSRTKVALKSGKLKAILFHQGETDAASEKNTLAWAGRFESMVKSLRREFGDVPFIAGELGRYLEHYRDKRGKTINWEQINSALHGFNGKIDRFRVVSSKDLTANADNLHFNAQSLREFGRRYAQALFDLRERQK